MGFSRQEDWRGVPLPSLRIISRSIHVATNGIISLFLWLSNFPLYIWVTIALSFSVNGPLGYFHVLAVVNSTATNTGVYVSFQIMFFL